MKRVLLDTSFLVAMLRRKDLHHAAALNWRSKLEGIYITTEYVLIEFVAASAPPALRERGLGALRVLQGDRKVEVIAASSELMEEGLSLFGRHGDKDWGLTDCISFAVMRRYGIEDALTADRHFEQAGFRALLRSMPG